VKDCCDGKNCCENHLAVAELIHSHDHYNHQHHQHHHENNCSDKYPENRECFTHSHEHLQEHSESCDDSCCDQECLNSCCNHHNTKSTGCCEKKEQDTHIIDFTTTANTQLESLRVVTDSMSYSSPVMDQKCNSCDNDSNIPHAIKVTRFRIANLCCAGEEQIIRSTLTGVRGIECVDVNVIGRYAIVKHCPVPCCAPSTIIIDKLNVRHLGASVAEAAGDEETDLDQELSKFTLFHVAVVFSLFILGTILSQTMDNPAPGEALFLVSTGLGLIPVIYAASISLLRTSLDIHVLMVVATAGAIVNQEYLDSSLLMSLFVFAEALEAGIMIHVRKAVRINTVTVPRRVSLADGKIVSIEMLKVGDIIGVRAGEMIVADGIVTRGDGVVDESALTGEALPISKKKGERVVSGSIVQNGYLEVTIDTTGTDSSMSRLKQAVLDVQTDKGTFGRMLDRISQYWTFCVLTIAACVCVGGGVITGAWKVYGMQALVVLVLACPCALVLAAPVPSACVIAWAARRRVLIRGSTVVEKAGVVTTVALDKTGTLTKGFFRVIDRLVLDICEDEDFNPLELAASLEEKSAHPLANAIVSGNYLIRCFNILFYVLF
jgi:cation transport ATPase